MNPEQEYVWVALIAAVLKSGWISIPGKMRRVHSDPNPAEDPRGATVWVRRAYELLDEAHRQMAARRAPRDQEETTHCLDDITDHLAEITDLPYSVGQGVDEQRSDD